MSNTRRTFLKLAGQIGALGLIENQLQASSGTVVIVIDPTNPVMEGAPVQWAAEHLRQSIQAKNVATAIAHHESTAPSAVHYIKLSPACSPTPEAFSFTPGVLSGRPCITASAADPRGYVYALLELADRVATSSDPILALSLSAAVEEAPANRVRSIARAFVSEVEDKPWYNDKNFWREYLTTLASSRFNRFTLTFGLGYDFPKGVTGDYFHFAYPYLLEVPGYNVRPVPLAAGERERNLEMLKFISDETAARGMQFQLALWTHAYQWTDSPHSDHHIEGLTPETHGPYCRDAMTLLLKTCPAIQGVTMRVHGESGIPEGSIGFWRDVFDGIVRSGRKIELDMHAKGLDQTMLDLAHQTGLPVTISPKFWAEHMGLGYHQADIRPLEIPPVGKQDKGIFALSEGSRRFLRYGYGDLFKAGRTYDVMFRMWPGTQHLLLWGDPATAAAYGRASHFCGASGVEICEPLFFKGRQGSGHPGGRCAYAEQSLNPRFDFQKFNYTYRVWGAHLYNPDADPETWRRPLNADFGPAAASIEKAIQHASRVLPLFTTTRLPSASNLGCWPEMYTNMPIVEGSEPSPYSDTVVPRRLGTVSPLDPQLFSSIQEYIDELETGTLSGKYTPLEVAAWLDRDSTEATSALSGAISKVRSRHAPEFRRVEEDVLIQAGLGSFFAAQIRSAILFERYKYHGDAKAFPAAITQYRLARNAWAKMAERAKTVYVSDVSFGDMPVRRGHWIDRLAGIDKDLTAMDALTKDDIDVNLGEKAERPIFRITHKRQTEFRPGNAVQLSFVGAVVKSGRLFYRHVDHAERWQSVEMERQRDDFSAAIPADYTNSPFELQYYFELRNGPQDATLHPGFNSDRSNQPYYVIKRVG